MQEGKRRSKEGKESNVFTQTRCGTGAPCQHQHGNSRRAALRSAETDSSVRAPAQAQLPLTVSCLCFCRNNDTHWGPEGPPPSPTTGSSGHGPFRCILQRTMPSPGGVRSQAGARHQLRLEGPMSGEWGCHTDPHWDACCTRLSGVTRKEPTPQGEKL